MAKMRERGGWIYSFWAKALAFLLAAGLVPVMLFYGVCMILAYEQGWYSNDEPDFYQSSLCQGAVWQKMPNELEDSDLLDRLLQTDRAVLTRRLEAIYPREDSDTNLRFVLLDDSGATVYDNTSPGDSFCMAWNDGRVRLYVRAGMEAQDGIFWAARAYSIGVRCYRGADTLLILLGCAELVLLVLLGRMAGRSAETGEVLAGWQERIPLDVYLTVDGFLATLLILLVVMLLDEYSLTYTPIPLLLCEAAATVGAVLLLAGWMTLCTRIKLGKCWRNTVIFWCLRLCWRCARWCWRICMRFLGWLAALVRSIPLIWRTALCCFVFSLLMEYNARFHYWGRTSFLLLIASLALCWIAFQLRKLQKGGQALARGDLEAQMDTAHLYGDFRRHGDDLNAIRQGMRIAVDQQTRSERLKAELITNVSHDIKTPLTSIINYVDLLQKEHTPEQEKEYLEILARQSRRLKKLTEDLVEMSKASAGSLPCHPTRRSALELVEQVMGEYEDRLEKAGLIPVTTLPQEDVFCMADGALIWRVLDNLLSNACKYALSGTRLYLSVTAAADTVSFTLRNISRDALNVSAEELMERFVRGDSSRTTEGSGLGLNIAKSLMELQGGQLHISVDGDLFKASAVLPRATAVLENLKENPGEGLKNT